MNTIPAAEFVKSVYSGKNGKCCCGCSGNHSDKPAAVARIVRQIANAPANAIEIGNNYVSAVVGDRRWIAYFA